MLGHSEFGTNLADPRLQARESRYQKIEGRYKAFCVASQLMSTQDIRETVNYLLRSILELRATGKTAQEKKEATLFLENMLVFFERSQELSSVVKHMFSDSLSKKLGDSIFVPALVFAGYYPQASVAQFSLAGLSAEPSELLCLKLYRLRASGQSDRLGTLVEIFLEDAKKLLDKRCEDRDDVALVDYREFIEFLYQCFDQVAFPKTVIDELETEMATLQVSFGPYAQQERDRRVQSVISRSNLVTSLNEYHSESWLGWFWNTLLCGVFGQHQSYTIEALKRLLEVRKDFYTEDEIKQKLEVEPKYLDHRLGFFVPTGIIPTISGTDQVLVQIKSHLVGYS